jgi:hypothetical protein
MGRGWFDRFDLDRISLAEARFAGIPDVLAAEIVPFIGRKVST